MIEAGLRALDGGLAAAAGPIDLLGVDDGGSLVLVAVAERDADSALARLLDRYLWAGDHVELLARAAAGTRLDPARPVRCLLLSPSFDPAFLLRLTLLNVEVTPFVACRARSAGETAWFIEPASRIFGVLPPRRGAVLETEPAPGTGTRDAPPEIEVERTPAVRFDAADDWLTIADGMPADDRLPAFLADAPGTVAPGTDASEADAPDPGDAPAGVAQAAGAQAAGAPAGVTRVFDAVRVSDAVRPAPPFEPLSMEEMEEFERFDRERRDVVRQPQGGRSS